jgi:GMP synthase-like glutamine amidotransferase
MTIKLCILDNDILAPDVVAQGYASYGAMFERLFREVGVDWTFQAFRTPLGEYPASFDEFDAVLLTGSKADSFSDEPWVVTLREKVTTLIAARKPLLGVCFGHQLIAYCMGANVGRAPQGWGIGAQNYPWLGEGAAWSRVEGETLSLLAAHQDQVLELPKGAELLAGNEHCPIAAFTAGGHILSVQPHPEFDQAYEGMILDRIRPQLDEPKYQRCHETLSKPHDGLRMARTMVDFVERALWTTAPV